MFPFSTKENLTHEDMKTSFPLREFHLNIFSISEKSQLVLFTTVLLMYLLTVFGNLTITAVVCLVSQLQTPMYFFLCNLSVQDILYVSAILPKFLAITITGDTKISFSKCITQLFIFALCLANEFLILTSMAYDRYVAICLPLHYSIIMNKRVCTLLASLSWLTACINSLIFSMIMSQLSFCNLWEINHFFCDVQSMLNISCSDTKNVRIYVYAGCLMLGVFPFLVILVSYIFIISAILKIRTTEGRRKTFSSCSSHLIVVILFCGTSMGMNMKSENNPDIDKILSMVYIAVVPMLNPLVYSLRNKEFIKIIKKRLKNPCLKHK
ncbi:olfactory receptor 13F1-like [Bombina bombina]|uniref:olfactory receptor 13F1-like n=1 Tax=Bombina bombina TaxID=8345 RepID=UPI00235AB826|nr:olfactory receptor 13F1-like [Bombina bombina]